MDDPFGHLGTHHVEVVELHDLLETKKHSEKQHTHLICYTLHLRTAPNKRAIILDYDTYLEMSDRDCGIQRVPTWVDNWHRYIIVEETCVWEE